MGLEEALAKYREAEALLKDCDVNEWSEQTSDQISKVLASSESVLEDKVRQFDDEVTRLSDFIVRCWNSPSESATIKVVQPHAGSAGVAICHCSTGSIVVKSRGQHPQSSLREETYNRLACYLSMPQTTVLARSFRLNLKDIPNSGKVKDTIAMALRDLCIEEDGSHGPHVYVTVEQFVDPGSHPIMEKFTHDSRFVDIDMAFKCCPAGKPYSSDLLIKSDSTVTDKDFAELIESIDNDILGELVLISIITLQRDGTPVNIVLRSAETGSIDLIAIDNTRTFSEAQPDKLLISFEEDDSRYGSYWYPCCIALPGALSPLNPDLVSLVQTWDVDELEAFVARFLKNPHDARCCRERVEKLQEILKKNPEISMKELAWAVVPSWKNDWDEVVEEYELGPLPRMQELTSSNLPLSVWAEEEKASRCRSKIMKICGVTTAVALLSYCAPRIILKYACPSQAEL
eukprot:TRINITY_DN2205_c0_g1_i2.p1 TRINITY_DN2205_c0_g1~~TRINITY_DN2205_c0_g1_i2.p1  ORF type:complete len:459 (+),score=72.58 TRINITY_DN2205_c0_g1_i2:50-1426(+)